MAANEKPPGLGKLHISIPLMLKVDAEGMPAIMVFFLLVVALTVFAYLLHDAIASVLIDIFGHQKIT